MGTCDVCGTAIDADNPPATTNFDGQEYCFCCDDCKQKFDTNPQQYAQRAA
jgi:YHS domain-containing protein